MTPHDATRRDRALNCDRTDIESVRDAVRGLQSTDDPSLVPLHDELMALLRKLENSPPVEKPIIYGKVPRRFRKEIKAGEKHPNGASHGWYFGCYFPQTDLVVGEMGGRGTGMPKDVEWLDEPANEWTPPKEPLEAERDTLRRVAGELFTALTRLVTVVTGPDIADFLPVNVDSLRSITVARDTLATAAPILKEPTDV